MVAQGAAAGDVVADQIADQQREVVAVGRLLAQIGPADGAAATGFVDDGGCDLNKFFLLQQTLDRAQHAVRRSAGGRAGYQFYMFERLSRLRVRRPGEQQRGVKHITPPTAKHGYLTLFCSITAPSCSGISCDSRVIATMP